MPTAMPPTSASWTSSLAARRLTFGLVADFLSPLPRAKKTSKTIEMTARRSSRLAAWKTAVSLTVVVSHAPATPPRMLHVGARPPGAGSGSTKRAKQ